MRKAKKKSHLQSEKSWFRLKVEKYRFSEEIKYGTDAKIP